MGLPKHLSKSITTRQEIPWSPAIAVWDKDARWGTHYDRILYASAYAAEGSISQREQSLEGSRRIRWCSILDVECPICGVGVDEHCHDINCE